MASTEMLNTIGQFSSFDHELFERHITRQSLNKNDLILKNGEVCQSFYFVVEGSFVQFRSKEVDEQIVDLHVKNEWMFNQESLTEQSPSATSIRAFSNSEVLSLSLHDFHNLCAQSKSFLQFGKILNQTKYRTSLYDNSPNPFDKYKYITKIRPELINFFPLKLIASYLKVTPETLSRVRAID